MPGRRCGSLFERLNGAADRCFGVLGEPPPARFASHPAQPRRANRAGGGSGYTLSIEEPRTGPNLFSPTKNFPMPIQASA